MKSIFSTSNDLTLTLMRLVLGIVFFIHGSQLVLGWFGGHTYAGSMQFFTQYMHIPAPFAALAIAAEFFGGIGLIVGLLTRVAAFGIAVTMLVAIFKVHIYVGFFMNWSGAQHGEGYEYHLLAIALCVLLMVKGAGALSIDRALTRKQMH